MLRIAHRVFQELEPLIEAFRDCRDVTLLPADDAGTMERNLAAADVLVAGGDKYDAELAGAMRRAGRRPRLIQLTSTGVDSVRALGLPEGSVLCNAGSVWAPTVADHAMAMILAWLRRLPFAERSRPLRRWARAEAGEGIAALEDKTVLILGFGGIGREVAKRARAFGAGIVAVTRDGAPREGADRTVALAALPQALAEADIAVIAVPLADDTHHLIGAAALARMKRTAFLVNVARGPVVDEAALVAALAERRIAGAGLDVFAIEPLPAGSPLWALDNVILTPHVGGYGGIKTMARLGRLCRDNADRLRAGEPLLNRIATNGFPRW